VIGRPRDLLSAGGSGPIRNAIESQSVSGVGAGGSHLDGGVCVIAAKHADNRTACACDTVYRGGLSTPWGLVFGQIAATVVAGFAIIVQRAQNGFSRPVFYVRNRSVIVSRLGRSRFVLHRTAENAKASLGEFGETGSGIEVTSERVDRLG